MSDDLPPFKDIALNTLTELATQVAQRALEGGGLKAIRDTDPQLLFNGSVAALEFGATQAEVSAALRAGLVIAKAKQA